jgi:hypothetical protein
MNSPLGKRKVRLRGLGGQALCGVPRTCASATGNYRIRLAMSIIRLGSPQRRRKAPQTAWGFNRGTTKKPATRHSRRVRHERSAQADIAPSQPRIHSPRRRRNNGGKPHKLRGASTAGRRRSLSRGTHAGCGTSGPRSRTLHSPSREFIRLGWPARPSPPSPPSPHHPITPSPHHPFTRSPVHPFTRSPVHRPTVYVPSRLRHARASPSAAALTSAKEPSPRALACRVS